MDENSVLNPAVLGLAGVLMGSALSLLGNILSQYLSNRKEAQQWAREQSAKRIERDLEREKRETERIKELYHQSINCLSVYLSILQTNPKGEQADVSSLTKDIHHWLSKLVVERPDEKLLLALDRFLSNPDSYEAEALKKYVLKMVRNEARHSESADTEESEQVHPREIGFKIDKEFQRSLMIQGIELPNSFELTYRMEDLQPDHRKRLLDIYFGSYRRIPDKASLMLPMHRTKATVVVYEKAWEGKINPLEVGVSGVLTAWAVDFDRCLQEAQSALAELA